MATLRTGLPGGLPRTLRGSTLGGGRPATSKGSLEAKLIGQTGRLTAELQRGEVIGSSDANRGGSNVKPLLGRETGTSDRGIPVSIKSLVRACVRTFTTRAPTQTHTHPFEHGRLPSKSNYWGGWWEESQLTANAETKLYNWGLGHLWKTIRWGESFERAPKTLGEHPTGR